MNTINEIRGLIADKNFEKAFEILEIHISNGSTNPIIYVLKGNLIQVSDIDNYELDECEALYKKAIELDNEFIDGYVELGAYYHSIKNDSRKGLPFFIRAFELSNRKNEEVLKLIESAIEDLA
ncbi:MAG: hypothetical protein KDC42_11460 [Ignavibacteriae bacterium]|nr:hypothetical protein [Ignavibacteriota bacterium]